MFVSQNIWQLCITHDGPGTDLTIFVDLVCSLHIRQYGLSHLSGPSRLTVNASKLTRRVLAIDVSLAYTGKLETTAVLYLQKSPYLQCFLDITHQACPWI